MPVLIDASKAKVIERRRTQRIKNACGSCASVGRPSRDIVEQAPEFGFGHHSRGGIKGKSPVLLNFAQRANIIRVTHAPSALTSRMTASETLILGTYFFVLVILAVYGWHRYYLVYLYMKNKGK